MAEYDTPLFLSLMEPARFALWHYSKGNIQDTL
jgi:hypothetical protein